MGQDASLLTGASVLTAAQSPGGTGGGAPVPNNTIQGNNTGGVAPPIPLTPAQILTMLGIQLYSDAARADALIRAQSLLGIGCNVWNGTEFDKPSEFVATLSGSGTALISTTIGGGVVQVATGASASSQSKLSLGGASALGAQITNMKTSKWYVRFYAKMATAVDAAATVELQLNAASGGSSFIAVGASGATSTTNWRIRTFDHAGNPFIATAALPQTLDTTTFHLWELWNDGTNLNIQSDGVQQITPFAISGITAGDPLYLQLFSANGATAANREIDVDRMLAITFSN